MSKIHEFNFICIIGVFVFLVFKLLLHDVQGLEKIDEGLEGQWRNGKGANGGVT